MSKPMTHSLSPALKAHERRECEPMTETNRQQTVVERILEDESLRGELEDPAATALINWASECAGGFAADSALSDAEVEAATLAIRTAARQAASSGEQE